MSASSSGVEESPIASTTSRLDSIVLPSVQRRCRRLRTRALERSASSASSVRPPAAAGAPACASAAALAATSITCAGALPSSRTPAMAARATAQAVGSSGRRLSSCSAAAAGASRPCCLVTSASATESACASVASTPLRISERERLESRSAMMWKALIWFCSCCTLASTSCSAGARITGKWFIARLRAGFVAVMLMATAIARIHLCWSSSVRQPKA